MSKSVKRYEIRYWEGSRYSRPVGSKLKVFSRARRIVARLKRSGVEAFAAPMMVSA